MGRNLLSLLGAGVTFVAIMSLATVKFGVDLLVSLGKWQEEQKKGTTNRPSS